MSTMRESEFLAAMQKPVQLSATWRGGKRWLSSEVEYVIDMYGVKTSGQLGRKFGVSRNAITAVWDRAKKRGDLVIKRRRGFRPQVVR